MSSLNTEPKPSYYELNETQLKVATGGVTIAYEEIKFEYTKQKDDGTK